MEDPELEIGKTTATEPEPESETQSSKRRKVIQKTTVTLKIEENGGKLKNEGPPSDYWSWRKYGQKPIKGSPYPRAYYKCSTSKGCSAKKQVERCRTDASLLLITYTSSHNHPDPAAMPAQDQPIEPQINPIEEIPRTPNQEQPPPFLSNATSDEETSEEHFHYLESRDVIIDQEETPFSLESTHDLMCLVFDEEPISYSHLMNFSTVIKSEEDDDLFDDLEELPTSSFTSFMRNNSLFDESSYNNHLHDLMYLIN